MTVSANPSLLYLEDLHVGFTFKSRGHELDEKQIIDFAQQFDPQPFHLDPVKAQDTLFKGLAASGWHTAAITMRLIVETVPLSGGIIGAGGEANWPKPSRPGDILRVEGEIKDVHPATSKPDRGIVTVEARTLTQNDAVVQILTAKLVAFRRSVKA